MKYEYERKERAAQSSRNSWFSSCLAGERMQKRREKPAYIKDVLALAARWQKNKTKFFPPHLFPL